jgi:hypothetical protein
MFHPSIAAELAERGHDCRSVVADPALRQRADSDLVALAVAEGRTLVTNNVVDFERLRRDRIAEAARCRRSSTPPTAHSPAVAAMSVGWSRHWTRR